MVAGASSIRAFQCVSNLPSASKFLEVSDVESRGLSDEIRIDFRESHC